MNDKLKLCPFCGEEADTDNHYAKCSNPDCIVGVFGRSVTIEAWNTRHSEPDDKEGKEIMVTLAYAKGYDRCDKMWRNRIAKILREYVWSDMSIISAFQSLLSDSKPADKTRHCKTIRCRGLDEQDQFCPQCEYYYVDPKPTEPTCQQEKDAFMKSDLFKSLISTIPETKLVKVRQGYNKEDMRIAFEQSRLTHPMIGFKWDTFDEFIKQFVSTVPSNSPSREDAKNEAKRLIELYGVDFAGVFSVAMNMFDWLDERK